MRRDDHARDGETGLVAGGEDLGLIHGAVDFDAVEAGGAQEGKAVGDFQFFKIWAAEGAIHEALFERAFFTGGGLGAGERSERGERGGREKEVAAVHDENQASLVWPGMARAATGRGAFQSRVAGTSTSS